MFLHIGANKNIREKRIIGIFDTDNATISGITRKFLTEAEKRGEVSAANGEIPKSFVLYEEDAHGDSGEQGHRGYHPGRGLGYRSGKKCLICFSQLSSSVLLGRSEDNS